MIFLLKFSLAILAQSLTNLLVKLLKLSLASLAESFASLAVNYQDLTQHPLRSPWRTLLLNFWNLAQRPLRSPLRTLRLIFWNLKYKLLHFPFQVFFRIENKKKPFQSKRRRKGFIPHRQQQCFSELLAYLVLFLVKTKRITYQQLIFNHLAINFKQLTN